MLNQRALIMSSNMLFKTLRITCRRLPCLRFYGASSKKEHRTLQTYYSSHCLSSDFQQINNRSLVFHKPLQSDLALSRLLCRHFSTTGCRTVQEQNDKGNVVYRGPVSSMIKGVKIFSLSSSFAIICLQPSFFMNNQELPISMKLLLGGMINFLVLLNPVIVHYIAKRYVTEFHWNRNTGIFTAVTYSLFLQRQELQFTAADVRMSSAQGTFTFLEARGVPLFLDPKVFRETDAYAYLMGFDQPDDMQPATKEQIQKEDGHQKL